MVMAAWILSSAWAVSAETFETFLEPASVVDISTPYRDRIDSVHVRENDTVNKGTLLAELDSNVLKSRLKQTRQAAKFHGGIDAARALVSMRKNKVRMLEELEKTGNVRPQELHVARTELVMAEAEVQREREKLQLRRLEAEVIETEIAKKKLTSPIEGVVVKIYKQQAELIGGSDMEPLLTIVQLDPLYAVFHIPPHLARKVKEQQQIPLEVAGRKETGVVDFVSPVIDAQSSTTTVRIILANTNYGLQSGSRCTLSLDHFSGEKSHDRKKEPTTDQSPLQ